MNIVYKRILNLIVGHDYFTDGFDRFATLNPTAETKALLRNGKMLFKKLPHGVTVLYRTLDDESTPFIDLAKDQHFIFILKPENINGLLNVTDLDESVSRPYNTGNIVYFTNNPANATSNKNNPEILSHEIIDTLRSPLFTYRFSIDTNPATVKIIVTNAAEAPVSIGKDADGNPLPETISLSICANNTFEQQVDLRDYEKGRYRIRILNESETITLKEEEIYVDEQLKKESMLGIVDIVYDTASNNLYGETEEYKLQFHNVNSYWKYYIVNKSQNIDLSGDSLTITDTETHNGSPYVPNDFPRVYASIELAAKTAGTSGNSIRFEYSGGGTFPAIALSGETLSGGDPGTEAKGTITIVNNDVTGYTVSIGGIDFVEGTDFNREATPSATATNLIAAINANGSVQVTAVSLGYDILVNDLETLVFSSAQEIPFFEKPKLKIALKQTSDDQTIIANLPNPSHTGTRKAFADRFESEVYVFI